MLQKLQSNVTTNTQLFTGQMPFLSPNQQCQSTEGKISHPKDLLTPNSPGGLPTLSLTTKGSWLPWRRVAMRLVSSLMLVPQEVVTYSTLFCWWFLGVRHAPSHVGRDLSIPQKFFRTLTYADTVWPRLTKFGMVTCWRGACFTGSGMISMVTCWRGACFTGSGMISMLKE